MKFINKSIYSIVFAVVILLLSSCAHEHAEGDGHNHGEETAAHSEGDGHDHGTEEEHGDNDGHGHGEEHEEGEIHLSKKQIETMNIQFGDFSQVKINDFVRATGTLGLPPNALTSVSAKAAGFIKNSRKYVEGSYVKKGVIMAYLENPKFIQHQQDYLETAAELVFDRQELTRQQTLLAADAGVEKNVQRLQAEVNMKNARLQGIAKRLTYIGIDPAKVSADNLVQRVPVYAPMGGYITSISMHNGMYVTPEAELMEIVDENHLHLELDVFEQDIAGIKEKQRISYTVPALGNTIYEGEVNIIGKEFNPENKTVRVHGHLEKDRPQFIKDLFLEAKIWLNDQTVSALPEGAVIQDGSSSYIYIAEANTGEKDEVKFAQIAVVAGTGGGGFTSVKPIDEIPQGAKIVTNGAYYVYAQSKAGELEHEH